MRGREATIRDVADEAGVSTATVSRVLNGDGRVAEETAARVRKAIDDLGYNINQVARSLKTGATRTVGVVAPDLRSDFFMLLADSMDGELSSQGYGLIVCSSRDDAQEEAERLRLLSERFVDGIVVIPATGRGKHLQAVLDRGIPVVCVDRVVRDLEADAILVDNEGGAYAATRALVEDGYSRVGFLGGDLEVSVARERYEGYLRAMRESGLQVEEDFVRFGSLHIEAGYAFMSSMLSRKGAPDAYFIVNADTHVGATNYLMTEGRAHRDRIVFAAFDEMPYSPLLQFCRYSVSQPIADMGALAARTILERIGGTREGPPEAVRLRTTLIRH